jgi:hypothetical protein
MEACGTNAYYKKKLNKFLLILKNTTMKEIIVTVDSADTRRLYTRPRPSVSSLTRFVESDPDYDDLNYRVNSLARTGLKQIISKVETEQGFEILSSFMQQETALKGKSKEMKEDSVKRFKRPFTPAPDEEEDSGFSIIDDGPLPEDLRHEIHRIVDLQASNRSVSPPPIPWMKSSTESQTEILSETKDTQTTAVISKALVDYHSKVSQLIQVLPSKLLLNHAQIELFQELVKDIEESGKEALASFN